jgi:ribosomal protein S18 acetylase RimI-like enzyme
MITYTKSLDDIEPQNVRGFFVGWPNPPSPETHLRVLKASFAIELAIDTATGNVVGFANAIGDGVLSAYVPLLEVLPQYQNRGIGSELMRRLLNRFEKLYMIDLVCDEPLKVFYERFGMRSATAMTIRRFEFQSGTPE